MWFRTAPYGLSLQLGDRMTVSNLWTSNPDVVSVFAVKPMIWRVNEQGVMDSALSAAYRQCQSIGFLIFIISSNVRISFSLLDTSWRSNIANLHANHRTQSNLVLHVRDDDYVDTIKILPGGEFITGT